jgi:hypothetical protein
MEMITRKAILIQNYIYGSIYHDHEKQKTNKDIGLVKAYLKSQLGGAFEEDEIICLSTDQIQKEGLIALIKEVDYSFIYYTGHAGFNNRQIEIPLQNDGSILESELIIENKKQWLFFDCCRTEREPIPSPNFDFERISNIYIKGGQIEKNLWLEKIAILEDFFFVYYTTTAGSFAFTNNDGGYGTQLFFHEMPNLIQSKNIQSIKTLANHLNEIKLLDEGVQQAKHITVPSILEDQLFPIYIASASNE